MNRLILIFAFIGYFFSNINSQDPYYFFSHNGNYKYFVGKSEPPSNWREIDFDDSGWLTGFKRIGYGDGDDSTLIDTTTSLYLRIEFQVNEMDYCKEANFMIDYDDAFIAYLNNNEMWRSNIGVTGDIPTFDQLADKSHEANEYRSVGFAVNGYYIDSNFIKSNLKIGKNILAIQLHNDSLRGSDLSINCTLFNLTGYEYYVYDTKARYRSKCDLDSSKFPIVVITSNEYGIQLNNRYNVKMGIIDNGEGNINRVTDYYNNYFGFASIGVRGQSSSGFTKRSYNFETQDAFGNNYNTSVLGLPKENDWILFGPFADRSQIRNEIIFTLGRKLGHYEPRTRFCEVIIDDEYVGLYVLTEDIKIDKNRLNITKLGPEDNSGINLTGGYIYKYDKSGSYCDPDDNSITGPQKEYISGFFKNIFNLLNSPGFLDPDTGYTAYIDTSSLIDYIILNELCKNADSYLYSTYLHKDRDDIDGKVKYGPLWDYDISFGNATFQEGNLTNGWQFEYNTRLHITEMLRDPELAQGLSIKWFKLRQGILHNDSLNYLIDSLVNYIAEAVERNYTVWPIIKNDLFSSAYIPTSYANEIEIMKEWIFARAQWIDDNINDIYYPIPEFPKTEPPKTEESEDSTDFINKDIPANTLSVYPNPFNETLKIYINSPDNGNIQIDFYDILGKKIKSFNSHYSTKGSHIIPVSFKDSEIQKGIYILNIKKDNQLIHLQKIIKL